MPLLLGRAVHEGLAAHYAKKDDYEIGINTRLAFAGADKGLLKAERDVIHEHEAYAVQIVKWYVENYPREEWTILSPEIEGSAKLGAHTYFFRVDGVISWKGHPWLLEHKTTSFLGATFLQKFKLDGQLLSYSWAIQQTLGVRPVGTLMNLIRKSKKLDRVEFAREIYMTPERLVRNYMEQVMYQADALERLTEDCSTAPECWMMHTGSCFRYMRMCEYLELCLKDSEDMRLSFQEREADYTDEGEEL